MKICKKGYEVKPFKCFSGWYLGTMDPEGGPNCRLSQSYAKTAKEAEKLDLMRCNAMENQFCAGGEGCGIHEQ